MKTPHINKPELYAAVSGRTGVSEEITATVIEEAFSYIIETVASGSAVQLHGFGTFGQRSTAPKRRKPGKHYHIVHYPIFSGSKKFKEAVRRGSEYL